MTTEISAMAFGYCWWMNRSRLGVWSFGPVLIVDRIGRCVVCEVGVGPWTVRAGVNR